MKIAIVGAGAMGGLFGARLALGGQEVSFVEASEATIAAIQRKGLQLVTPSATERVMVPIGRAKDFAGTFDLVVIFTKGFHTDIAIESVRHLVGPTTWALSVQNGLGNAELISKVVPAERIIVGMTNLPADLVEPGVVHSHGDGHINLWPWNGEDKSVARDIAETFQQAGLPCRADPEVQIAIWEKVAFNAALNSVCAITRQTVGGVGDSEHGRSLTAGVIRETVEVANALGVDAQASRVEHAVNHAFANHHQHKPSMLQDVEAKRKTEIDFINGAVVERANEQGIDTPVLSSLHSLVKLIEGAYL
ncbi:2-dehydropantoate 2-reductase [Pseudomonas sp. B21-017]|jgi:2-dehydropantoate 2-reductase|uniref:ketopantoate reductase family protein n=1 Tax=Pseudomonas TaxID=286 RepID=UPI00036A5270|nr:MULTISPECIES: 2-dehydropantoate 2-reductase [Pseudomonas]UVM41507.1 2-dehydropantoate 2-reductase [Pseudomonas sp. B21-017]